MGETLSENKSKGSDTSDEGRSDRGRTGLRKYGHARPLIGIALVSLLLCGLFFPLLIVGIAQVAMPYQANGEIANVNGHNVGSYLVDNGFTLPQFFWARNESNVQTASASGVDPDITVSAAMSQVPRISNATGIPQTALTNIVENNEQGVYWIIGYPYVDVLQLNLLLIHDYPSVYSGFPAAQNSTG